METYDFKSVKECLILLSVTVSPFPAFAPSYLQQTSSAPTVHDIVRQNIILKSAQRFGTTSTFCTLKPRKHELSIVLFADVARL